MKPLLTVVTSILLALLANSAVAQVARPGDETVEGLIENVQKTHKDFVRKLDSKVRNGKIRGATAEVDVDSYLEDYETDLERLEERFKPKYSASSEVQTVLRKGTDVNRFMDSQSASLKGRSEWDVAAAALKELAEAYGTTFPLPADGPPRRINDAEVEEAADAVAKHAQSYKKGLKDAFPDDKAALDAAEDSVDALVSAAKKLRSRVDSGKPASGEAGVVREALAAVKTAVGDRKVSEAAAEAWSGVIAGTDKIAQAFGAARPSAETAPTGEAPASAPPAAPTGEAPASAPPAAPPADGGATG